MKAVIRQKYGGPDVLQLREVERPKPADDQVLVRVRAASVNDWDWGLLHGDFINRLMYGLLTPRKQVLGSDVAGSVAAVGARVTRFRVGDEVYGDLSGSWGGFAEYVCARESALAVKPPGMTFAEAAAIPQAAMLAVQGLLDQGRIEPGRAVLINGAGGGVGTFAVQIAKTFGVEVTGVDSAAKLDMLRAIGFDHVIDYAREDFTRSQRSYDLILDVKATRSLSDIMRVLSPNGRYVVLGGSIVRLLPALLLRPWFSRVHKKHVRIVVLKPNKDLAYMNDLYTAGMVKPVIDGPFPLSEVPAALRRFGEGSHRGKIVITMS